MINAEFDVLFAVFISNNLLIYYEFLDHFDIITYMSRHVLLTILILIFLAFGAYLGFLDNAPN